eukprot:CAMPEP_0113989590 /NCGR_PEP_ID=MMETSP0328-20130328/8112_1 /TAXON_ID=39455 /ORGANISM="Alexandrium minutum" /LENGTH=39 /assembly_acc=CAM_ASM_000350
MSDRAPQSGRSQTRWRDPPTLSFSDAGGAAKPQAAWRQK